MNIKIEKNIPVPCRRGETARIINEMIDKMNPGDSVQFEVGMTTIIRTLLSKSAKGQFISKKQGDFIRFWRVPQ